MIVNNGNINSELCRFNAHFTVREKEYPGGCCSDDAIDTGGSVDGGPGSLIGSYVAAILVGLIDSIGKSLWPEASLFMIFAPMLLVLLVRPHGLFGRAPGAAARRPQLTPIRIPVPAPAIAAFSAGLRWLQALPARYWIGVSLVVTVCVPLFSPEYFVGVVSLATGKRIQKVIQAT